MALCYGTIGVTGHGAAIFNQAGHREKRKQFPESLRLYYDFAKGGKALIWPDPFRAQFEDGHAESIVEMQFVNGPIMVIHARYKVRLSSPEFFFGFSRRKDPLSVALTTLRMKVGKMQGKIIKDPVRFTLEATHPVYAQVDGEYFIIDNGPVSVGLAGKTLNVWATKEV